LLRNLKNAGRVALFVAASLLLASCVSVTDIVPVEAVSNAEFKQVNARLGAKTAAAPGCLKAYEKTKEGGVLAWSCSYALNDLADRYELNGDREAASAFVAIADEVVANYNTTVTDVFRGRIVGGWISTRYTGGQPNVSAVHSAMIGAPLARFAMLVSQRNDATLADAARRYLQTSVAAYREMEPDWADGAYRITGNGFARHAGSPLPVNMMAAMGQWAHYLDRAGASGGAYAARIERIYKFIDSRIQARFRDGKQILIWRYDDFSGKEDVSHAILTMSFLTIAYERKLMPRDRFEFLLASFLHAGVGTGADTAHDVSGKGKGIDFAQTCARALPIYRYSAATFRRCEAL